MFTNRWGEIIWMLTILILIIYSLQAFYFPSRMVYWGNLGAAAGEHGLYYEAIRCMNKSIFYAKLCWPFYFRLHYENILPAYLIISGRYYAELGDSQKALDNIQKGLKIAKKGRDIPTIIRAYEYLATLYIDFDPQTAEGYFLKAEAVEELRQAS